MTLYEHVRDEAISIEATIESVATLQDVVGQASGEVVIPGTAPQHIGSLAAQYPVVAHTTPEAIRTSLAIDEVLVGTAEEEVHVGTSEQSVGSCPAPDLVDAFLAEDPVVAITSKHTIVSRTATHNVVAAQTANGVVSGERQDHVCPWGADEVIVLVGADNRCGAASTVVRWKRNKRKSALGLFEVSHGDSEMLVKRNIQANLEVPLCIDLRVPQRPQRTIPWSCDLSNLASWRGAGHGALHHSWRETTAAHLEIHPSRSGNREEFDLDCGRFLRRRCSWKNRCRRQHRGDHDDLEQSIHA